MTVGELKNYLENLSDDILVVVESEGRSKATYVCTNDYFGEPAVIIEGS